MMEWAGVAVPRLIQASVFLVGASVVALVVLHIGRFKSPRSHAIAWWLVLLHGTLFFQVGVKLPKYVDRAPAEQFDGDRNRHGDTGQVSGESQTPPRLTSDVDYQHANADESTGDPHGVRLACCCLMFLWAIGVAVYVFRWTVAYSRFVRTLAAESRGGEAWNKEWRSVLRQAGVDAAIPLHVSENVGPLLCRLPRGYRIVVPAQLWSRLNREQRLTSCAMNWLTIHVSKFGGHWR